MNCEGGKSYHVLNGELVPGEGGEVVDCRGLPLKPLRCTLALRPFKDWNEVINDPVPPPEFVDSLLLVGVGLVVAPKGTKAALVKAVERDFVLDPMLPPEEVPEGGAVVARSLDADSSYGYKKKYGKWPVEHLGEKASKNVVLNPFWVTTWEAKKIKIPAFMPELVSLGVSSPVPPELLKAIYVPLSGLWGPDALARIETLMARSHYWRRDLRAEHADSLCEEFAGERSPGFWVGIHEAEYVLINGNLLTREDLIEFKDFYKNSPLL